MEDAMFYLRIFYNYCNILSKWIQLKYKKNDIFILQGKERYKKNLNNTKRFCNNKYNIC